MEWGGRIMDHGFVAPNILLPQVRVSSTPSALFIVKFCALLTLC